MSSLEVVRLGKQDPLLIDAAGLKAMDDNEQVANLNRTDDEALALLCNNLYRTSYRVYTILSDQQPQGFAAGEIMFMGKPDAFFKVEHLFIPQDKRRHKLGTALVQGMIEHLRREAVIDMEFGFSHSYGRHQFLESLGAEQTGDPFYSLPVIELAK